MGCWPGLTRGELPSSSPAGVFVKMLGASSAMKPERADQIASASLRSRSWICASISAAVGPLGPPPSPPPPSSPPPSPPPPSSAAAGSSHARLVPRHLASARLCRRWWTPAWVHESVSADAWLPRFRGASEDAFHPGVVLHYLGAILDPRSWPCRGTCLFRPLSSGSVLRTSESGPVCLRGHGRARLASRWARRACARGVRPSGGADAWCLASLRGVAAVPRSARLRLGSAWRALCRLCRDHGRYRRPHSLSGGRRRILSGAVHPVATTRATRLGHAATWEPEEHMAVSACAPVSVGGDPLASTTDHARRAAWQEVVRDVGGSGGDDARRHQDAAGEARTVVGS